MGQRDPERADLAAPERGGERPRASGSLIALLEQGMHALTELGELRWPLAPEQIAAAPGCELLGRARRRRLRHAALVGGPGEVERARDREKIPDLMHLHAQAPPVAAANLPAPGAEPP